MRNDIDERKDEIIEWLESGVPRFEVARRLKCKYDTLKVRLDRWGVTAKNQGRKGYSDPSYIPLEEYLASDTSTKSYIVKEKMWREGYKEKKCEECGVEDWFGRYNHLELDHIDGDHYNNDLSNLRILCANCHALTDTNSGGNIGSYT